MRRQIKFALIIMLVFIAVAAVNVGCGKKTTGKKSPKSATANMASVATKDWRSVKSRDGKFSLKVPREWEVKNAGELNLGKGKLFVAFGPEDANYKTNLQASVESVPNASMARYINQFEKNTRVDTGTKELKVLEEGKVDYQLGDTYRKKYSYLLNAQDQQFKLKFDVLYIKKGNNFYVVQIVTTDKLYDDVKKTFDNILTTIEVK